MKVQYGGFIRVKRGDNANDTPGNANVSRKGSHCQGLVKQIVKRFVIVRKPEVTDETSGPLKACIVVVDS